MRSDIQIPLLPGATPRQVPKEHYRKPHTLDMRNGYQVQPGSYVASMASASASGSATPSVSSLAALAQGTPAEIAQRLKELEPRITYRDQRYEVAPRAVPRFQPAFVAYDKLVLSFAAYYLEELRESPEPFHLRVVKVLYYVEDDTMAIVEPAVENSGILQGVLIARSRLPKSSNAFYTAQDLGVGKSITVYAKTFHLVSCDDFTRRHFENEMGVNMPANQPMPQDPALTQRHRPARRETEKTASPDKLKMFLENDRKVLRFYCSWDDTKLHGEKRHFCLHWYLVDNTVQVRELLRVNSGRTGPAVMLRRQRLPKRWTHLAESVVQEWYQWSELRVGSTINVLGRAFVLHDCDAYTRQYFEEQGQPAQPAGTPLGAGLHALAQAQLSPEGPEAHQPAEPVTPAYPPYNGFGTPEDSLGSCKYMILKPPRKHTNPGFAENDVLHFLAQMISRHPEDSDRRFVVSYHLMDNTISIHEKVRRNIGFIGGKFLERGPVLRSTVAADGSIIADPPERVGSTRAEDYLLPEDFQLGQQVVIHGHRFELIEADQSTMAYFEARRHD